MVPSNFWFKCLVHLRHNITYHVSYAILPLFFLILARGLYSEVKGPQQLPIMQAATITMIKTNKQQE